MKRYLFLSMVLLLTALFVIPVAASDGDSETFSYYDQLDENGKAIYDAINNADAETHKLYVELPVTLTASSNDPSVAKTYLQNEIYDLAFDTVSAALRFEQPYAYWMWGSSSMDVIVNITTTGNTSTVSSINLVVRLGTHYTHDPVTEEYVGIQSKIDELKEAVNKFTTNSTSIRDKVMDINNYIVNMTTYDPNVGTSSESRYAHDAYGVLVDPKHYAVCEGYSEAFMLLCMKEGINCTIVYGSSLPSGVLHAWNYVQLEDGKWYAIDVTWNDGSDNAYFLQGYESFSTSHQQWVNLNSGFTYKFNGPALSKTNYDQPFNVPNEIAWVLAIVIGLIVVYALYRTTKPNKVK